MSDKVKVRVVVTERVHYDQVIEMPEHEYERLMEADDEGDQAEVDWLVEKYLDRENVDKRAEFEAIIPVCLKE